VWEVARQATDLCTTMPKVCSWVRTACRSWAC